MFEPRYRITGPIAKALMSVEADSRVVANRPLTVRVIDALRRTARLLSTHLSTQIEGNKRSPKQVRAVIEGEGNFPGRERDEAEVRHCYVALEYVERLGPLIVDRPHNARDLVPQSSLRYNQTPPWVGPSYAITLTSTEPNLGDRSGLSIARTEISPAPSQSPTPQSSGTAN